MRIILIGIMPTTGAKKIYVGLLYKMNRDSKKRNVGVKKDFGLKKRIEKVKRSGGQKVPHPFGRHLFSVFGREGVNRANKNANVIFETRDVVMLKPDSNRGVLVGHRYDGRFNVTTNGLRSGKSLKERNSSWDERTRLNDVIFFRAPFYKDNAKYVDEFSGFGKCAFIRIDPERTYVYPSEVRVTSQYYNNPKFINKFRKPFKYYMEKIEENERRPGSAGHPGVFYNMLTFEKIQFPPKERPGFPFTRVAIERSCEILVHADHISPELLISVM